MPILYHVLTANYLHRTKRFFETHKLAIDHIKKIVDMKECWVTKEKVLKSFKITKIDTDLLPEYAKIFKENSEIKTPAPPNEMDLHGKKKKLVISTPT